MNPMDIMTGLNGVRDSFIIEAEEFRQGKRQARRLPQRRLWLIAAVVALALLLVGCAVVYVLRLQDLKVGRHRHRFPILVIDGGCGIAVLPHLQVLEP